MLTSLQTSTIRAGNAPDWIHLLPVGTFKGADGRGPYNVPNPAAIMAVSMMEGKLCVDVNHSTDLAAPHGQPSPAIGWIVEMQRRPDGVWGRVEWTPAGRSLFAEKSYRGVSPVFAHDDKGNVIRILRASLTNVPNIMELTSLHARQAALGTYQPTETDRLVFAAMGLNVQDLVAAKSRQATQAMVANVSQGLSQTDLTVCQRMGIDPAAFAGQRNAAANGENTFGLSPQEQEICRRMNINPMDFAAQRAGGDSFGLTRTEQDVCRRAKVDFRQYADWKRAGGDSPLVSAVPPESMALCKRFGDDPADWAVRYFSTPIPGQNMRWRQ
nr:phage protease [uncultured Rhodopila sp.]